MKWRYWPFSAASADSSLPERPVGTVAVAVDDAHPAAADFRDITLVEEHEAPRDRQQRGDVGRDEALAQTKP